MQLIDRMTIPKTGQISCLTWTCKSNIRFITGRITMQSRESHSKLRMRGKMGWGVERVRVLSKWKGRKREWERTVTNRLKSGLLSFIHLKCKSREADSEHTQLSPPLFSSLICIERTAGFVWTLRLMNFMAMWALQPVHTPRCWWT